ncbi:Formamidase [Cytidiella melzeri]|nr:Formamidase [Cytidiella melzeri]
MSVSIHSIKRSQCHLAWDSSIPPVIRVKSGESVHFDCLDASNGQVTATSSATSLNTINLSQVDQVNGPVYVELALPGDTLQVEVLEISTAEWGWTGIMKGFGLLADEFPNVALKIWDLREGGYAWFNKEKGIKIPLRPFAGEMGVAPAEKGPHSTIPPYKTGGNIDTKHVTKGTTLYLPVAVEGALFSMGDGHAAQGDGEVCGTAIETMINVTVKLTVLKNKSYVKTPHFLTPHVPEDPNGYYCTTGVAPDIREATRDAVRHMIAVLCADHGLTREEAYMLCSVAGDLRMHEVVDMPNYVIGMMMPRSIFGHSE